MNKNLYLGNLPYEVTEGPNNFSRLEKSCPSTSSTTNIGLSGASAVEMKRKDAEKPSKFNGGQLQETISVMRPPKTDRGAGTDNRGGGGGRGGFRGRGGKDKP
jgi:hypothetical protein